jgi:type II secretory pathway pseudopilin PulG
MELIEILIVMVAVLIVLMLISIYVQVSIASDNEQLQRALYDHLDQRLLNTDFCSKGY